MQNKPKKSLLRRLLGGLGMALLTLVMIAVFYLAVILGDPQEPDAPPSMLTDQPLVNASPAINVASRAELEIMLNTFPAPVLHPIEGVGLTITGGTSYDTAFENGFGRILKLYCQTAEGEQLVLTSIYPARALALLPTEGYRLTLATGHSLAGMRSVRMEQEGGLRLHAQGYEAIYAVDMATMDNARISELTRSLHLYEGR